MSNRGRVGLLTLALWMTAGCGDDDEPTAEPETPVAEPAPEPPPSRMSCALEGETVPLAAVSGPAAITAVGESFVVASFAQREDGGEDFWMARVAQGTEPVELARLSVTESQPERHPNAAPALATIDARTIGVAVVGRRGEVSAGRLVLSDESPVLTLTPVENGARRTDPPVVLPAGERLAVAWTQASTYPDFSQYYFCSIGSEPAPDPPPPPEPIHGHQVRLAMIDADGTVHTRRDATPRVEGAEAVAPVALAGADPPALLFLDPRSGIGTVHRVGVRAAGFVEPETVRPLSNLRDQTDVAAAEGPGGPWLAYGAVGDGATSAIGLVSLANAAGPEPLVPGTVYRPLRVDGTSIGTAAVFAAEAPNDADGESTAIHVRAVNAAGPGRPLVLGHTAASPAEEVELTLAPRPRIGPPEVRGSLASAVVARVIRSRLDTVRACHASGIDRRPGLQGRLSVRFIVAPTGAVQATAMNRSNLGDPAVEHCILTAIREWTFPEPDGGGILVVTVPITLGADGDSPLPPEAPPAPKSVFAPAIAARASDGLLAVVYGTAGGARMAWVRCGE